MEGGGTSNKPSLNWRVLDHLMWMTGPLSVKCRSPRVRCLDGSKTLSKGDTRLDLRKKEVQQWIGTKWPHELEGKYPAAYAVRKVSSVIGCFCRWPVPIILLRPFLQRDTGKLVMASHGKQWYRCSNISNGNQVLGDTIVRISVAGAGRSGTRKSVGSRRMGRGYA